MAAVLIVEDNAPLNDLYARLLAYIGFTVTQARSCQQAIEHLRTAAPQVVLLDLSLPDGSGLSVAKYIKSHPRLQETQVILASGYQQSESQIQAAGIAYVLYKPVSTMMLLDCLKDIASLQTGLKTG